jgi:hypothetical protein
VAEEAKVLGRNLPLAALSTTDPICHDPSAADGSGRVTAWATARPYSRLRHWKRCQGRKKNRELQTNNIIIITRRKLKNEEIRGLYSTPVIIRMMNSMRLRLAVPIARIVPTRNAYKVLVWMSVGKRPPGRPRRRWVDINMGSWRDMMEEGVVDWSYSG